MTIHEASRRHPLFPGLSYLLAALAALNGQRVAAAAEGERLVLENGVTLMLLPVLGGDRIGVEAFYRVGFIHEPKGMTQAAHLLEHLVCNAATASYKAGESMNLMNKLGMANAETLPDWTHYDYVVPCDKLELALKIEAERLTSLRIEKDAIAAEAPRCYQETDFVEANPASGMTKHAFMALAQAWRHGAEKALVRGGLEEIAMDDLRRFHAAAYRPERLTLILVGGFERDRAVELVRKHIGAIRPAKALAAADANSSIDAIEWSKVARRGRVQWDAKVSAVCIAYPPPADETDRAILSLWGTFLNQKLMSNTDLQQKAYSVFCTNNMWPAGELPFFIYAAVKPGATVEEVEKLLTEQVAKIVAEPPTANELAQLRMFAQQLPQQSAMLTWDYAKQTAKTLAPRVGGDEGKAIGMILGQAAINWGVADRLAGGDPAKLVVRTGALTVEQLQTTIKKCINADKRITTTITPAEDTAH